jgi:prepilin-type processing-associated H-X9-DG protein
VYLNIFDLFYSWKKFIAQQEHSQKFCQKKGGKNILFLDGNMHYLEGGRWGPGVVRVLTKKICPMLFFQSWAPLGP